MGSRTETPKAVIQQDSTPEALPVGTPSANLDSHSWIFQAVMEIQKSIGKIEAKADALTDKIDAVATDVRSQKEKIDNLRLWIAAVGGGFAVISGLAALVPQTAKERIIHYLFG